MCVYNITISVYVYAYKIHMRGWCVAWCVGGGEGVVG